MQPVQPPAPPETFDLKILAKQAQELISDVKAEENRKLDDSALQLEAHAITLDHQERDLAKERKKLDLMNRELMEGYAMAFQVLSQVTLALKGMTEDDLALRLQDVMNQVSPVTIVEHGITELEPIRDEAIRIRTEISFRGAQKAHIDALQQSLKLVQEEHDELIIANQNLRRQTQKQKELLKSRSKSSLRVSLRFKSLYPRYKELYAYAKSMMTLTHDNLLSGDDLWAERRQLKDKLLTF